MTHKATHRNVYRRAICFCQSLCLFTTNSLSFASVLAVSAIAQSIVPDDTLGVENSVVTPVEENFNLIQGGAVRGSNVFHSFDRFGIESTGIALFLLDSSSVENVFSRVTGDLASSLAGTLSIKVLDGADTLPSNANFYLINPNGIVFKDGAALDIGGSFFGTTASGLGFDSAGSFSAINPALPGQLLTINPSAYLFETPEIGEIRALVEQPTRLEVQGGESVTLLGGNVSLRSNSAAPLILLSRGGRVEIGAVGGTGRVDVAEDGSLRFSDNIVRSNITFEGAVLSTTADPADSSRIGDDINVIGQDVSALNNDSFIIQTLPAQGTAEDALGSITINAKGSVLLNNSFLASVSASPSRSGEIEIEGQSIEILNGTLATSISGEGDAGNITLSIRGDITLEESQIASLVGETASGSGGDILLEGESISISGGSQISAATSGSGSAGNIVLDAENDVLIVGSANDILTGIIASVTPGAIGNGGDIQIFGRSLRVANGGNIDASVLGKGDGGDILIDIREQAIFEGISPPIQTTNPLLDPLIDSLPDAPPFLRSSSLVSSTVALAGEGDGGDIRVTAGSLKLLDGATFITGAFATGDSGDIFVSAADIELRGVGAVGLSSSIATQADYGTQGTGGDIEVNGNRIRLIGDDTAPIGPLFTASARGEGNAGNIRVTAAEELYLSNAQFDTFSERRSGGDITVVADRILLEGSRGGNITTQVFSGKGTGGNITLNAESYIVALDDTDILGSSPGGRGGNIIFQTPAFFGEKISLNDRSAGTLLNVLNNRVDVNATGRIDGSVSTPDVSLVENNLTELADTLVDADALVANSCIAPDDITIGQFTVVGREATPQAPDDFLNTYRLVSVEPAQIGPATAAVSEPSAAYRLINGQMLLSKPCETN